MENHEEWYLEISQEEEDYKYKAVLKNEDGEVYEDAMYIVDLSDDEIIKAQAYGYFKKDWDLKLEAIELIKLYIQEM